MSTLILRLAAPMQSWGVNSRFVRRTTQRFPTKSGIIGLLASALGYRRTDSIEDLLELSFGVRIDQPGELLRDFQTARTLDEKTSMPLTTRYYLSDAIFLAGIFGEKDTLVTIAEAIKKPAFPLYLGRRSCPPAGKLLLDVLDQPLFEVLESYPWQASKYIQERSSGNSPVSLQVSADASVIPERATSRITLDTVRDVPLSFDPERREYGWRQVATTFIDLEHQNSGNADGDPNHDPMLLVGG